MIQLRRHTVIPAGIMDMRVGAPASAAVIPWYLAGGAPTPVAVYQPKGAADLAASYVNLVNPGTYDAAPGTAPGFNAATGWTFNGSTQYLTTGIVPSGNQSSILARFSNASTVGGGFGSVIGLYDSSPGNAICGLWATRGTLVNKVLYGNGDNGDYLEVTPDATAAPHVMCVAGKQGYRDGATDGGAISAGSISTARALFIGCGNINGTPTEYLGGIIQAIAIYSTTLTGPQVLAVTTAVNAL